METKKYRRYLIFSIIGLIISIAIIAYFHATNDSRVGGFYVIAAADIIEIARDVKRYRDAKEAEANNINKNSL